VLIGGTSTGAGTGGANTALITAGLAGLAETGRAAQLCADYSVTRDEQVYDDWFLPSKDELNLMYTKLKLVSLGGFASSFYWSSSEYNTVFAWNLDFRNGEWYNLNNEKCWEYHVRPVRAF
jgi:hypothetical protein